MGDLPGGAEGPINVPLRTWDRATSKSFEPIDTFQVKLEVHCRLRERERERERVNVKAVGPSVV
jgi:hypothetical protein